MTGPTPGAVDRGAAAGHPAGMRQIPAWFGLTEVPPGEGTVEVLVLGCPFEDPVAHRRGTAAAPGAIRRWARTAEAVTEEGWPLEGVRVVDAGDVEGPAEPGEDRWRAIAGRARELLGSHPGAFLLALGGDHGVTPPLVAALRERHEELGFLMLDAHPDAFDRYEGNPLSHACVVARVWDRVGVSPEATALVGLRSYALQEVEAVDRAGLDVTARDWARLGTEGVARELEAVLGGRPVYLSVDIDVLEPAAAPGTGYPVAGGPGMRELLELLAALRWRLQVVAMDLVEVAPDLDPAGITAAAAAHLCLQVLGQVPAWLR